MLVFVLLLNEIHCQFYHSNILDFDLLLLLLVIFEKVLHLIILQVIVLANEIFNFYDLIHNWLRQWRKVLPRNLTHLIIFHFFLNNRFLLLILVKCPLLLEKLGIRSSRIHLVNKQIWIFRLFRCAWVWLLRVSLVRSLQHHLRLVGSLFLCVLIRSWRIGCLICIWLGLNGVFIWLLICLVHHHLFFFISNFLFNLDLCLFLCYLLLALGRVVFGWILKVLYLVGLLSLVRYLGFDKLFLILFLFTFHGTKVIIHIAGGAHWLLILFAKVLLTLILWLRLVRQPSLELLIIITCISLVVIILRVIRGFLVAILVLAILYKRS